MHFMVTQGIRDRATLKVNYPMLNKKSRAGEVNPAAQQLDFYIRSPQVNQANNPRPRSLRTSSRWRSPGNDEVWEYHSR